MEASEFQKVQIKGKSRLKTDVYNNNSFDLGKVSKIKKKECTTNP